MASVEKRFELGFPSRPEHLILGREVCGAMLEFFGAEPAVVNDVKTALTEACNNAIIHGYSSEPDGFVVVAAEGSSASMEVAVFDSGSGLKPHSPEAAGLGMGLPLIASLSDQYEISGAKAGTGTTVRMCFGLDSEPANLSSNQAAIEMVDGSSDADLYLKTDLSALIPRFVLAAGSGTDLDVDRLSDLDLAVNFALQPLRPGECTVVLVNTDPSGLKFRIGPLTSEPNLGAIRRVTDRAQIDGTLGSGGDLVIDVRQPSPYRP